MAVPMETLESTCKLTASQTVNARSSPVTGGCARDLQILCTSSFMRERESTCAADRAFQLLAPLVA